MDSEGSLTTDWGCQPVGWGAGTWFIVLCGGRDRGRRRGQRGRRQEFCVEIGVHVSGLYSCLWVCEMTLFVEKVRKEGEMMVCEINRWSIIL